MSGRFAWLTGQFVSSPMNTSMTKLTLSHGKRCRLWTRWNVCNSVLRLLIYYLSNLSTSTAKIIYACTLHRSQTLIWYYDIPPHAAFTSLYNISKKNNLAWAGVARSEVFIISKHNNFQGGRKVQGETFFQLFQTGNMLTYFKTRWK